MKTELCSAHLELIINMISRGCLFLLLFDYYHAIVCDYHMKVQGLIMSMSSETSDSDVSR